ncbi:hypothetical protein [Nostoc sp. FACHB-133]|uniref:hypothetical protein n=1 Tax=Nostoc sp. FACHB-133 TaxID=2692835 RepID=UPI001F553FF8|nr:hypothetical protein [Nostoc sp. FACHB-133]
MKANLVQSFIATAQNADGGTVQHSEAGLQSKHRSSSGLRAKNCCPGITRQSLL